MVGGTVQTAGAVLLAAEAALRAGAGKLALATVAANASALAVAVPESQVVGLASEGGNIAVSAADEVVERAQAADLVLVGPGFSDPDASVAFLGRVLPRLECPVVMDALASAYLTDRPDGLRHLEGRAILTVNPSGAGLYSRPRTGRGQPEPARRRPRRCPPLPSRRRVRRHQQAHRRAVRGSLGRRGRWPGARSIRIGRRTGGDRRWTVWPMLRNGAARGLGCLCARTNRGAAGGCGREGRLPGARDARADPLGASRAGLKVCTVRELESRHTADHPGSPS